MKKIVYTSKLGNWVSREAKSGKYVELHVVSSSQAKWAVVRDGSDRSLRVFEKKNQAISYAKGYALSKNGTIIVHQKDGRIDEKVTRESKKK